MNPLSRFLLTLALGGCLLLGARPARGQVNITINRPTWGPQVPAGTQYYYIPEIDGFYDLYSQRYIVRRNGRWLTLVALSGYDPYYFHPVPVTYRGRRPWRYVSTYRARYPRPVQPPRPPRPVYPVRPPRPVIQPPRPTPPRPAIQPPRPTYSPRPTYPTRPTQPPRPVQPSRPTQPPRP
ncbi:hypothetical protein [Hymenobacter nivis]|uniref:hypothetical protein n=1 Tax=Hymenobacter nivis TaxID=1850093 RepID=UPI00187802DA|nr:hypothetical protein [Hymenobacter nivis]